jgi:hypothetical protein
MNGVFAMIYSFLAGHNNFFRSILTLPFPADYTRYKLYSAYCTVFCTWWPRRTWSPAWCWARGPPAWTEHPGSEHWSSATIVFSNSHVLLNMLNYQLFFFIVFTISSSFCSVFLIINQCGIIFSVTIVDILQHGPLRTMVNINFSTAVFKKQRTLNTVTTNKNSSLNNIADNRLISIVREH